MAKEFIPTLKYKTDKKTGKKKKIDLYKGTTIKEIVEFLENYGTDEDRKSFKADCKKKVRMKDSGKVYKTGKHEGKVIFEPVKDENGNNIIDIVDDEEFFNWLYAKQKFFEKFAPSYLPEKKKDEEPLKNTIMNW